MLPEIDLHLWSDRCNPLEISGLKSFHCTLRESDSRSRSRAHLLKEKSNSICLFPYHQMRISRWKLFVEKDTPVNERSNWGQFGPLESPQNVFSKFLTCSNPELSWLLTGGWRERCCGVKLAACGNMWRVIWDGKRDADGGGVMWLWGPWPEENGDCMRGNIPCRGLK